MRLATGFSCFFGGAGDRTRTDDLLITRERVGPIKSGFLAPFVSCVLVTGPNSRFLPRPCEALRDRGGYRCWPWWCSQRGPCAPAVVWGARWHSRATW